MKNTNFAAPANRNTPRSSRMMLLLIAIIAVSAFGVSAQQLVWSENSFDRAAIATDKAVSRQSFPKEFKLYNLNIEPLRQQLFSVAGESARGQSTIISLPNADGKLEYFEVTEASNFEPELQAKFPEIRAYSGRGITDQYATLKLSISPQGIQTTVFRTDTENEFIEPYSQDHGVYAVYKTNREAGKLPWACSTEDKDLFSVWKSDVSVINAPSSNAGQIKTMRLAQSCNGEYANYFGATSASQVGLVLAAFNATLTRANGVYEKDLAVHLNLIPETTAVIYYDPATDPYTTLASWNAQLQSTLTTNIGEANYDIGHMFGASGGGGNAGCIGCVCVDGSKGSGITSPADGIPMGDNFDIDYVVHEMGHQMGANHTFSFQLETGTGQNKEVGSGITIMGYAGITAYDVAPHSIDTFHETSIQQIQTNLGNKTCPVTTVMTANHAPVLAALANYTIPITTPFALTGSATDAENDPITYQWEQNDNSTVSGAASVASPTKLTGPNWLSFLPTTSPTRIFPRLSTILSGLYVTPPLAGGDAGANIEALSSVSRTLNFRLTARDNHPYVAGSTIGQTQFADSTVTVVSAAGPFRVTTGNTATTFVGGFNRTITWSVNNTNIAPISAANVKISLSTDGGLTFPTVLAASTPNDGSESLLIPNTPTSRGRIKVEAVGNIFFDINDADLNIVMAGGPADVAGGNVAITAESCGIPNNQPDPGETLTVSLTLTNNGGSNTNNLTATLQATGGVATAVTQSYGAVALNGGEATRNFTFTVSPNLPCGNDVVLTFVIADGSTTFPNVTKTYSTGANVVSFSQNFDGVTAPALPVGWTSVQTSGTAVNWVTTTTTPSSTPNAAFGNEAATVNAAALVSPAVAITSAGAQITFKNKYNLESGFDGTVLEYSTDGATWTDIITGGGSFVSGGYNGTISTGFMSPIGGRMAWTGNSTAYVDTVVNLPASLNGQSVRFRWLRGDDSSAVASGAAGQWVDDVQVLGARVCQSCDGTAACRLQRRSDFNGDGTTDFAVFRPSTNVWYVQPNGGGGSGYGIQFGASGDQLQPADYDGDGKTDIGVYRGGVWYWIRSSDNTVRSAMWGTSGDVPVAGDYVGTEQAELAVYRPSSGIWYALNLADNTMTATQWGGAATDIPMPGDYDGDCKLDLAVRRTTDSPAAGDTQFYIRQSTGGATSVRWGRSDYATAIADYDGDGKSDIGVVATVGGQLRWYVIGLNQTVIYNGTQFGITGDTVTVGNYDSDAKADLAIWRSSGGFFSYKSTANGTEPQTRFGAAGDIPTARAAQYPLP